jgi:hypothetical protein
VEVVVGVAHAAREGGGGGVAPGVVVAVETVATAQNVPEVVEKARARRQQVRSRLLVCGARKSTVDSL